MVLWTLQKPIGSEIHFSAANCSVFFQLFGQRCLNMDFPYTYNEALIMKLHVIMNLTSIKEFSGPLFSFADQILQSSGDIIWSHTSICLLWWHVLTLFEKLLIMHGDSIGLISLVAQRGKSDPWPLTYRPKFTSPMLTQ